MKRTLSSAQTFAVKYIFPTAWVSGFTFGTVALFAGWGEFHPAPGFPDRASAAWAFLGATVLGTLLIWWSCMRVKRVQMDDHNLYISNYIDEIEVPLSQVEDVRENRWINIHPVTVEFRRETAFGTQIVFMPKVRWWGGWSAHPVVAEMKAAAARARNLRSAPPAA